MEQNPFPEQRKQRKSALRNATNDATDPKTFKQKVAVRLSLPCRTDKLLLDLAKQTDCVPAWNGNTVDIDLAQGRKNPNTRCALHRSTVCICLHHRGHGCHPSEPEQLAVWAMKVALIEAIHAGGSAAKLPNTESCRLGCKSRVVTLMIQTSSSSIFKSSASCQQNFQESSAGFASTFIPFIRSLEHIFSRSLTDSAVSRLIERSSDAPHSTRAVLPGH